MLSLYLIRGLPGSGKSSFASTLKNYGVVDEVFEADDFFTSVSGVYNYDSSRIKDAHAICKMNTRYFLSQGQSVAVSNTTTTEFEVGDYEMIAIEFNAKLISAVIENRHGNSSIHDVPNDVVQKMKNRFSIKLC